MSRAQCLVHKQKRILMVKHQHKGEEWWCLPGGRIEEDETPEQAALRELREECRVQGTIIRPTSVVTFAPNDQYYTYQTFPSLKPRCFSRGIQTRSLE